MYKFTTSSFKIFGLQKNKDENNHRYKVRGEKSLTFGEIRLKSLKLNILSVQQ